MEVFRQALHTYCRCMHTHPHSVLRQQHGWMEPQGLWSIMHTNTPSSFYLLPLPFFQTPPFIICYIQSSLPLFGFALPQRSQTYRLTLNNVTPWCFFPLSIFPTFIYLPLSLFPLFSFFYFPHWFPPRCPYNPSSLAYSPPNFCSPSLAFLSFSIRFSAPLPLRSLTYLFGADIVVFMRAASPTAAEGRPNNLALVAALRLVRQMNK